MELFYEMKPPEYNTVDFLISTVKDGGDKSYW